MPASVTRSAFEVRPVGDQGVLIEVGDAKTAMAVARTVRARLGEQVEDVVPTHATVLVTWRGEPAEAALGRALAADLEPTVAAPAAALVLEVRYDGPDLDAVAALVGCSPEEVARRHAAPEYTVGFIGFAPGFAYLLGTDPSLHVPRRETPRERVAPGSVAIAAGYTSVYPTASPGGWQLLGSTEARMFDPAREPAVLLAPGARVRFTAS